MDSAESAPFVHRVGLRSSFGLIVTSHFLCACGFAVFSLFPKYLLTVRGLSQAQIGPSVMGFPLGALLFSPAVAFAMSRYSKAAIVRGSGVALALLTAVCAWEPPLALLPVLTFLVGGASMGIFNGGAGLTAEVAPDAGLARALGFHGAAGMLGQAVSPTFLEPLATRVGWPSAFLVAAVVAMIGAWLPLPKSPPRAGITSVSLAFLRPLGTLMVVSLFAGIMHNALWISHQPLVLARGGHEVRGYFVGMSSGALAMRVLFAGLPDRIGRARSATYALALYVLATLGMTWVVPGTLWLFGLVHGIAHGVFYPSMAALASSTAQSHARGEALIALYAAFNIGATAASVGFARFGEAYGPAAVFPCAALIGFFGWVMFVYALRTRAHSD